jgi:hypothetical protein
MNLQTQNVQFGLAPSMALGPSGRLIAVQIGSPVDLWLRLDEKLAEKAQHTQVCEHFEGDFSSNLSQKWTFLSIG